MISFDEAISIIRDASRPVGSETVPIDGAAGRVLVSPVVAAIDSPRAHVSAMDGYAVRQEDLSAFPARLIVAGESFPGKGFAGVVEPGTCVRIFTGAPLPEGADRIVIQEEVRREGEFAFIEPGISTSTWIRARGADFAAGSVVVAIGRPVDAATLVAIAGADQSHVRVSLKPRVAVLATGDELVPAGQARQQDLAIPDSVTPGLLAFAPDWGGDVVSCQRIGDELRALERAASEAVDLADVVVVTGGASIGARDFAKAMFQPLAMDLLFSKVAIRPGKPAWLGRAGEKLVLGLPGNPTSALVTARLLLAPLLSAMQGRRVEDALSWEPANLMTALGPCDERETFHRATLTRGEASLLPFQESHAQKTLGEAQVLIRQSARSPAIPAGERVNVLRL